MPTIAPVKPPIINGNKYDFLIKDLEVLTMITQDTVFRINATGTTNLMSRNNNIKGTIIREEPKPLKPNIVNAKNTMMLDKIKVNTINGPDGI